MNRHISCYGTLRVSNDEAYIVPTTCTTLLLSPLETEWLPCRDLPRPTLDTISWITILDYKLLFLRNQTLSYPYGMNATEPVVTA